MSYIVTILLYLLAFIILFAICHWVLMQINTKQRLRYRIAISGSISTACIFLFYLFSKGVFEFLKVSWLDALDILLVAFLLYQLYKLVRGTVAINIFIGLASIYLIWQLVKTFQLQLLSEILGQFIGVGVIILAIVFQQELRKFLIMIGRARIIKNKGIFDFNLIKENKTKLALDVIMKSCKNLSLSKTGAIIVLELTNSLDAFVETGVEMNAKMSVATLESIFYKNSPLHDGAVIIKDNRIIAARCVLPITNNDDFPGYLGMRHRAAAGLAEDSDAIIIVVSEQTGNICFVKSDVLAENCSLESLRKRLDKEFS